MLATAILIFQEAWIGWQHPKAPDTPLLGLALNGSAGVINLFWALLLIRNGKQWKSPALVAGGRHILTDVWTTIAVLIAFALIPVTGWLRLDPAIGGLVAVNILWAGYGVVREAVAGLMDEVSDPELISRLDRTIAGNASGAIEAHDVRARVAGNTTFIEFHLVVPTGMTVGRAHEICDHIEHALRTQLGQAVINIHIEPEEKAKHGDVIILDRHAHVKNREELI